MHAHAHPIKTNSLRFSQTSQFLPNDRQYLYVGLKTLLALLIYCTGREMVLYQPVYRAENDNEIPPLISDEDWTDHMA